MRGRLAPWISGHRLREAALLQKTLDEEKVTDRKLTTLAEGRVNMRAAS
jgi:ferritin-like metal-binding protein YciE